MTASGLSSLRSTRRRRSSSKTGGMMKMRTAPGTLARTWRAPWTSMSRMTSARLALLVDLGPGRSVELAVDAGPLEEPALPDHALEDPLRDEMIFHAVVFGRPAAPASCGRPRSRGPPRSRRTRPMSVDLPQPDGPLTTKIMAIPSSVIIRCSGYAAGCSRARS